MRYIPHTQQDRQEMLDRIGVASIDDLFVGIPKSVRLERGLNLGEGLSELELQREMAALARKNQSLEEMVSFLGAGAYDHFIPAALPQLISRSEFYTSYTPYQAEMSQGMLQAIYEYQSMICQLTGMEVSNASHYDGATAAAEAGVVAVGATGRQKVLVSSALHPEYRKVIATYARAAKFQVVEIKHTAQGVTDLNHIQENLDDDVAALLIGQPNFFGMIEPMGEAFSLVKEKGGLAVAVVNPISLGLLKSPGDFGADLVVGEGQSLGNPVNFGGPYLGFFAALKKWIRRVPGRIAGATEDTEGRRGFVLTLQTREQHIRREKATSNICSNQALNALAATIYLSLLGKEGLRQVAETCLQNAHYLADKLKAKGYPPLFEGPFFMEFAVAVGENPRSLNERLAQKGFLGGMPLRWYYPEHPHGWLLATTEQRTRGEMDSLVEALEGRA